MKRFKRVILTGLNDEVRNSGGVFLNGQLLPLETPMEMDERTIEHLKELKNYRTVDYRRMSKHQVLKRLEENGDGRYYTLEDAEELKRKAVEGQPDIRLSPLVWERQVAVEEV